MFPHHIPRVKPRVPYTPATAVRILNALAEGRGLRQVYREPGMPTRATVIRWLAERPDFARLAALARQSGGLDRPGRPPRPVGEPLDEIYLRLCFGERLRDICRDPRLPSRSTVHAWLRRHPEAARVIDLGRQIADEAEAERRLEAMGGWAAMEAWASEAGRTAEAAGARRGGRGATSRGLRAPGRRSVEKSAP